MKIRLKRFLVCSFGPTLLGALPFIIVDTLRSFQTGSSNWALIYLGFGFIFAVLPSIVYFGVMEAWFIRKKKRSYFSTSGVSALTGLAAGGVIGYAYNYQEGLYLLTPIGLLVGAVLGFLLELITRKDQNQAVVSTPLRRFTPPLRDTL